MKTDQAIESKLDTMIIEAAQSSGAAKDDVSVHPDMVLNRDFGFDSLDFVDLISAVEEKFDIVVDDRIFGSIETVEDLHKYVSELAAAKAATADASLA